MTMLEAASDTPSRVARALTGASAVALERVGGGRNSRVFRVRAGDREFALKQYPSRAEDPRDRLGTEFTALKLMERFEFKSVPRVEGVDRQHNMALLSWIEGRPVTEVDDADIDQACDFLSAVHGLRLTGAIPPESLATEACLSGAEIERQVRARRAQLRALPEPEGQLFAFLDNEFDPASERFLAHARTVQGPGLDFDAPLPQERRSLVPSDFGFHNSLRQSDGSLAFFDFEYFGWDDPVKLTADVMLHPGTPLSPQLQARFRAAAQRRHAADPSFRQRLDAFLPLFGLRWALILLNEFHPERWRRRQLAGATEDWSEAKARQLGRARVMITNTAKMMDGGADAERR
jgi:hypothetical protein